MNVLVYFFSSNGETVKLNRKAIDISHMKEEMDAIEYLFGRDKNFKWAFDRSEQEKLIHSMIPNTYIDPCDFSPGFSKALREAAVAAGL